MVRYYVRRVPAVAIVVLLLAFCSIPCHSLLALVSPTENQIVREMVKVTIPASALPAGFVAPKGEAVPEKNRPFAALLVQEKDRRQLVTALAPDAGAVKNGVFTFYWDSKAPYREKSDAKADKYFKDGKHTLIVELHDATGKVADSASVTVDLRNKVDRSKPAPAVALAHRLNFGQINTYDLRTDVQVFEMVSGMGLPILGGLGISGDFKVILNVEDVRDNGDRLLRCRIDRDAWVSSFGRKSTLFQTEDDTPQLYRLIRKTGEVITPNLFSRQGRFTIMDVLPVMPAKPVKEGDSWPCGFTLKIEGITRMIAFSGTSMLDSFEWQDGHECAKIISRLSGQGALSLANGKIKGEGASCTCTTTTYLAYKSGRMIRNVITLEFPATILPGAGESEGGPEGMPAAQPPAGPYEPESEEMAPTPRGPYGLKNPAEKANTEMEPGTKKGSVQINLVVRLEK